MTPNTTPIYPKAGTARVSLRENNFLSEENEHAVVGQCAGPTWHIQPYTIDQGRPLFLIFMKSEVQEALYLSLDTNVGDNENNVMVKPLGWPKEEDEEEPKKEPVPRMCQLWVFRDGQKGPPVVARMQNVARPWLSASISGDADQPMLGKKIAGVTDDPSSSSQNWTFDGLSTD